MEDEQSLYFQVHGKEGPYLLMVHGFLTSRAQWLPNLEELKTFCRPVVIELFGHGRSPSPDDIEIYSPDSYVREFERIRHKLGIEKWFICGQSLGAALTFRYALTHPEQIIGHIFTNSRSALTEESFEDGNKLLVELLKKEGRKVIDQMPLHPSRNKWFEPEIKKALVEDAELIDLEGFANTAMYTVVPSSVRGIVENNVVPTLLIAGRFDKQFTPYIELAPKFVPKLEMAVVDAGHAVNIGDAESFNRLVREFIERNL